MARNASLLALTQYLATVLGLVTTVITARFLGPENYGLIALITAYPSLLWSLLGVKSVWITTRYLSHFRVIQQHRDLAGMCKLGYGIDLSVAGITLIIASVTSFWVAERLLHRSDIAWLMVLFTASFPFYALAETSRAILSSYQRFQWLAALQLLEKALTLVIVFVLLWSGYGVPGVVGATALGHVATGLAMTGTATWVLNREIGSLWWNASIRHLAPLKKELRAFFGWSYVLRIFSGAAQQIPLMLLGHLGSAEQAGFYRLATSLTTVASYPGNSLTWVTYPTLAARWSKGEQTSLKTSLKRWTVRGGLPASALVLLSVPLLAFVIPALFGASYEPMISGAQFMMVGAAVNVMFFWLSPFYYATGNLRLWVQGYSFYASAIVAGGWFCAQQGWGFWGLASLTAAGDIVLSFSLAITASVILARKSRNP